MREHRSEKIHELFVETKKSYPLSTGVRSAGYHFISLFLFWTIFIPECPVQRCWLEWGPDEKKKQQKTITDKKKTEQLSIAKVLEAQFGLDLKCLFRPNPNIFISCSLLRARGSVFQILVPLLLDIFWCNMIQTKKEKKKPWDTETGASENSEAWQKG